MAELEADEQLKYSLMWHDEGYRKSAPNEEKFLPVVVDAICELGIKKKDTIIDYGCGNGAAVNLFNKIGMNASGVDFVEHALDREIPFIRSCLWELPDISSKWAFSTDVMEHIPEEKVTAVLDGIRARTTHGAYFLIHLGKDPWGFRVEGVGEELHVTQKPAEWWANLLFERWPHIRVASEGKKAAFSCEV